MTFLQSSFRVVSTALVAFSLAAVRAQSGGEAATTEPVYLEIPPANPSATVSRQFTATEKYPDGKLRVERGVLLMSDDEVINHGKYTEYYRNGKKFTEGNYKNGVYDGEWSFWYDDGTLAKKVTFKEGRPHGSWEAVRADGTVSAKRGYKDGKRDGQWISYYEDGKTPKIEQNFVDGALEGDRTTFYESGVKHQIAQFKAGVLDGKVTEWDESGAKTGEAKFVDGKINGEVTQWAGGSEKEQSIRELESVDNENASRRLGPVDPPADKEKELRLINH